MPNEIFRVTFKDGTTYKGGSSIYNSGWDEMPDKEISCLAYFIEEGEWALLEGHEAYAHLIEVTQNIHGPKGTDFRGQLRNAYIMTLKNGVVTSHRISLKGVAGEDRFQRGDRTKRNFPLGKEFKGRPVSSWKKGIK